MIRNINDDRNVGEMIIMAYNVFKCINWNQYIYVVAFMRAEEVIAFEIGSHSKKYKREMMPACKWSLPIMLWL